MFIASLVVFLGLGFEGCVFAVNSVLNRTAGLAYVIILAYIFSYVNIWLTYGSHMSTGVDNLVDNIMVERVISWS